MSKQYKDATLEIPDPRDEAADIFKALKATLVVDWAKDLSDLTRLSASLYNSTLSSRRYNCLFVSC